MKFGASLHALMGTPVDVAVVAQAAEALGFESIWLREHPAIPVKTYLPFPATPDGVIPEAYAHDGDPFVHLARASAVTNTIKLGTGICLIPLRNPLVLAKEVATLDHYSGGRFLFGLGAGWLKDEMEILGGDPTHKWGQTGEAVRAMKELWTKDEAEFHGRHFDFPPVRSFPKPVQKPHPPVLLAAWGRNALQRIVAWGDGWIPVARFGSHPYGMTPEQMKDSHATLMEMAAKAGRDPRSIETSVFMRENPETREIRQYEDAGGDRAVLAVSGTSTDDMIANLETTARRVM